MHALTPRMIECKAGTNIYGDLQKLDGLLEFLVTWERFITHYGLTMLDSGATSHLRGFWRRARGLLFAGKANEGWVVRSSGLILAPMSCSTKMIERFPRRELFVRLPAAGARSIGAPCTRKSAIVC